MSRHARGSAVPIPSGPVKAPERLCVWRPGAIVGDFGECWWDEEAARAVMAAYEARGNPIPIDIEHNSNTTANPGYDPSDPPEGGGYCWLKVVDGALWLDPIDWSDFARHQIETKSRRAISPDWDYDLATKRPVRLNKVSLVQNPGTYGIGLIASAGMARADNARGNAMDLQMLMAMIAGLRALAETATDETVKTRAAELAQALEDLAASLGLDLTGASAPEPEPAAGSDLEPAGDLAVQPPALAADLAGDGDEPQPPEDEMQKLMASARALLAGAKGAPRRAAARRPAAATPGLTPAAVQAVVRKELAEDRAKQGLLASAKNRPGMTPALASYLMSRPLPEVQAVVNRLPRPAPAQATQAPAGPPTAAAGPVKVGPLGTTAGAPLSAAEQARIDRIANAGATREEIVEGATAGAGASPPGTKTFSAFSQMKK